MTLLVSLVVSIQFAAGVYLMLKRDLIRVITGVILLGNAANLFIMSAGLRRGAAPLVPADEVIADSLVQAMTLTAIVISFGVAALILGVVYRVYDSHHSVDVTRLSSAEVAQAALDDQDNGSLDDGAENDPEEAEPEVDGAEPEGVVP